MSNLIAPSQTIVSLDHVITDPSPGGAITIVNGDREAIAANDCDDMRWRTTTRKVRRLLRHKITPRYETLYTGGPLGPPETSSVQDIDDGGPCADADGAEWSGSHGHRQFG